MLKQENTVRSISARRGKPHGDWLAMRLWMLFADLNKRSTCSGPRAIDVPSLLTEDHITPYGTNVIYFRRKPTRNGS